MSSKKKPIEPSAEKNKEAAPVEETGKDASVQEAPAEEPKKRPAAAARKEAKAASETEESKKALESARAEVAAEKEKYLRLAAEYDNFRKRSSRERDNIYADVKADTLEKLLPIYDDLERALKQETQDEAFRKGVEMTMAKFEEALKSLGVTPIEALGKTFDPTVHNAVMHTEDPDKGENEVVAEFQKGFKMGDRVIRFSMVQVAN